MPVATVTDLSVMGVPGGVFTFDPKTEAVEAKGNGPFTDLSVMAVPGGLFTFAAKDPATDAAADAIYIPTFRPRRR